MNKTLSPQQIRLVVGLGVLAVAVLAWMLLLRNTSNSTTAPAVSPKLTMPTHHA